MKYIALLALALSFSSFAEDKVPCEHDAQNGICEYRPYYIGKKHIFSRGVGLTYAKAEEAADNRLYAAYPNISCGIGVTVAAKHQMIRLRDGRSAHEVWVECHPKSEITAPRGGQRQGVCLGCGSGKGGVIVRGIPGL